MTMPRKILVSPVAYNEHVKLQRTLTRYLESPAAAWTDCVVIDDASDDGTTDMIRGFAGKGIKTVRHASRRGVGAAIRTAIQYGREHGYKVLVIMAGNNKDSADEISLLTDPIINGGFDFVQGSRYLPSLDGVTRHVRGDMPFYRRVATRIHPWLLSWMTGRRVTDSTNGFRAMRLSLFDDPRLDLQQAWLDRYELEVYLLIKVIQLGYRFTEAPVTKVYPPRELGYTKMRPVTGWWSILRPLVYLGLRIKK